MGMDVKMASVDMVSVDMASLDMAFEDRYIIDPSIQTIVADVTNVRDQESMRYLPNFLHPKRLV
jgi:hypothetical protein